MRGSFKVFLAGSIEMNTAERWQDKLLYDLRDFRDSDMLFMNPRRSDWDSSWKQEASNPEFAKQVNWELDRLEEADLILFYFDGSTKSPITLMELGIHATRDQQVIVYCPSNFWRAGNVDILCQRSSIPVFRTYDKWLEEIRLKLTEHNEDVADFVKSYYAHEYELRTEDASNKSASSDEIPK